MAAAVQGWQAGSATAAAARWRAFTRVLRWGGSLILLVCFVAFALTSWHWRVVNDAALMHYVVFLAHHGGVPYATIRDINFPGAYLADWVADAVASTGALSADHLWRVYDLSLLVAAGLAMVVIAWPVDWFAGVFAGGLFALFHGRDGMGQAGQRDLLLAVLVLWASGAALAAWRRHASSRIPSWVLWACAGFLLGAATTVKPVALLFLVGALNWAAFGWRGRARPVALAATCGGFLAPLLTACGVLVHWGAAGAFWRTCRLLLPYHASLGRAPLQVLLGFVWPASFGKLGALAAGGLLLLSRGRRRRDFLAWVGALSDAFWVALGGAALGLVYFFAQGKGYSYQRYPFSAFLLLWVGLVCSRALRSGSRVSRTLAAAGLLFGVCVCAPSYLAAARRAGWQEPYLAAMQQDLKQLGEQLGSAQLDGRVQCIDSISGCVNVLYRMGLRPATGTLYDEFLFPPRRLAEGPLAVREERAAFWRELTGRPPEVLVISSWLFPEGPGEYSKVQLWPEFTELLRARYRLADERAFARSENGPMGFRVYVLR